MEISHSKLVVVFDMTEAEFLHELRLVGFGAQGLVGKVSQETYLPPPKLTMDDAQWDPDASSDYLLGRSVLYLTGITGLMVPLQRQESTHSLLQNCKYISTTKVY